MALLENGASADAAPRLPTFSSEPFFYDRSIYTRAGLSLIHI